MESKVVYTKIIILTIKVQPTSVDGNWVVVCIQAIATNNGNVKVVRIASYFFISEGGTENFDVCSFTFVSIIILCEA